MADNTLPRARILNKVTGRKKIEERLPKVACVVLGAGLSSRFRGTKQLAKVGAKTMIQNALDLANESKADYSYVVLGHDASEIIATTKPGRAQILLNKDYERGISTSLKTAISNLAPDSSGVLFLVGDQPFLERYTLDLLIGRFKKRPGRIVALAFKGDPRNPVIIPKKLFQKIQSLKGDSGAKKIVKEHPKLSDLIEIEDEKTFLDVDTRSDLKKNNFLKKKGFR